MNTSEIISRLNIENLNEMQEKTIESMAENKELILLAPTGSGKTIAFLIPLINSLDPDIKTLQALILVPSRELALQIETVLKKIQPGFKVVSCYGGHKREIEENNLTQTPAIIIGTAGRMADHIRRLNVDVSKAKFLVLDEFDKSLELGFVEEMKFIIGNMSSVEYRMLTSATNALEIPDFVGMKDPATLSFTSPESSKDDLRIYTVLSDDKDKLETLFRLLCYTGNTSSIVFCNHRDAVERTSNYLNEQGINNVFYHGGMEQIDRETALVKFRNTTADVLVTTDLASRGLDIADIRNIIHYHLPNDEAAFTHRNGRTARMQATGNVYVVYSADEKLPHYVTEHASPFDIPAQVELPAKPKWSTLFIAAGKKDKINKMDIVGFLTQRGRLKSDEIGLIEVKDFTAFVAVRKSKLGPAIELIKNEKIKNKKVKIAIAR
jgi:superfamily II DNA/RNA helicase